VLGRSMDRSFLRDPFRLRRRKSCLQRRCGMGMEMGHPQTNFFPMRIMLITKCSDKIAQSPWVRWAVTVVER
jgi:hypothetical protein